MRTPKWYLKGFYFLERINPKRYHVWVEQFMEGMTSCYQLRDKHDACFVGPKIWKNNVKNKYGMEPAKPH